MDEKIKEILYGIPIYSDGWKAPPARTARPPRITTTVWDEEFWWKIPPARHNSNMTCGIT
jgi:hypothetical protein